MSPHFFLTCVQYTLIHLSNNNKKNIPHFFYESWAPYDCFTCMGSGPDLIVGC